MKPNFQLTKVALAALALFSAGLASAPSYGEEATDKGITPEHASPGFTGTVYTMSNAAGGNAVLMFNRAANGSLTPAQSFPTGGLGTGAGLGNGHGLVLSDDGRWLLVVNAGSDELSLFAVGRNGLQLTSTVTSGGTHPISVTVDDDLVYVLNGGSENIAGFHISHNGRLKPLADSVRPLGGTGNGPAEISFSPDGRNLVITEKASNQLVVFPVATDGMPAQLPNIVPSAGQTPFGFAFAGRSELLVADAAGGAAGASAVSSYRLARNGILTVIDRAVPTYLTAACWIAVAPNQRYAYTADTPASTISGFHVGQKGGLTLLNANGVTASPGAGSRPIDLAFSQDGRFLYSLNSGNQTISTFRVNGQGALAPVATVGIPAGANGLAAR
jgi:6-phosphogluconolactonase